mgnify:CR=1 FL=1
MPKILVTGAAGFIGYHLSKYLLERDDQVIGLDNLNEYYDVNLKQNRLKQLISHPEFKFVKLDLADRFGMEALFDKGQFDKVVNLAAQAGVRYSLQNPHSYVDTNVVGFINLLEGCRHSEVKHLVFASSSSVYGANTEMPFSVQHNVDHPVSLYAATKKSNELMAHTYAHLYQLPCTGLRFFTVYGPWGRPDMAYFLFTKAILENKTIDVFNHGNMRRDFTYIDDIINGLVLVGENGYGDEFGIGSSEAYSIIEIAQMFGGEKKMLPERKGNRMTADVISTKTEALGWKPTRTVKEYIEEQRKNNWKS